MKSYILKRSQFLPITVKEAWDFLSNPGNLKQITPEHMGFDILSETPKQMYEGMVIKYQVRPLLGIPVTWVTEITHVKKPFYFVDDQRIGPYKLWHHQHRIIETDNGVIMEDEVNYALPMGWLGRLAHKIFIKKQLHRIFEFRSRVLNNLFETEELKAAS